MTEGIIKSGIQHFGEKVSFNKEVLSINTKVCRFTLKKSVNHA